MAPRDWPGPADKAGPVFHLRAAELWRAWMDFAARQPRTVLRAQDERTLCSLHVQRSRVLHFPDLVRAEVVALGAARSGIVLDSRARFGSWDFGVNRRRVLRWVHDLKQTVAHDSAVSNIDPTGVRAPRRSLFEEIEGKPRQQSGDFPGNTHRNLCGS